MVLVWISVAVALLIQQSLAAPLESFGLARNRNAPVERYKALTESVSIHSIQARAPYDTKPPQEASEATGSSPAENPTEDGTEDEAEDGTENGKVPAVGVGAENTSLLELLSSTVAPSPSEPTAAVRPESSISAAEDPLVVPPEAIASASDSIPSTAVSPQSATEASAEAVPDGVKEDGEVPAVGVGADNTSLLAALSSNIDEFAQPSTPPPGLEAQPTTVPVENESPASPPSTSQPCASETSTAAASDATVVVPVAVADNTGDVSFGATDTLEGPSPVDDSAVVGESDPASPGPPPPDGPGLEAPSDDSVNLSSDLAASASSVLPDGQETTTAPDPEQGIESPIKNADPAAPAAPIVGETPDANPPEVGEAALSIAAGETVTLGISTAATTTDVLPESRVAAADAAVIESVGELDTTVTVGLSTTLTTTVANAAELVAASDPSLSIVMPESLASTTVTPVADPQNLASEDSSIAPTPTPSVTIETAEDSPEPISPGEGSAGDGPGMTIPVGDFTIVINSAPTIAPIALGDTVAPVEGSCPTVTVTTTVAAT